MSQELKRWAEQVLEEDPHDLGPEELRKLRRKNHLHAESTRKRDTLYKKLKTSKPNGTEDEN